MRTAQCYSPGVAAAVDLAGACGGGRCLRCGLPIRSSAATLPSSRSSVPAFTDRPPTAGSRALDSTSGAASGRSADNRLQFGGVAMCGNDDAVDAAGGRTAKKRVRFAPPRTDDVADDVSRRPEPVPPPPLPPLLPSSSFVKMQPTVDGPVGRSQLPGSYGGCAARPLSTFRAAGPPPAMRDASIV